MKGLSALTSFLRASILRSRMEREMDNEMRCHVDIRASELEAGGLSRDEAERRAWAEFGDVVRWKEASRDVRGLRLVDELAGDLRYAARMMRRAPIWTAAAIVSLALGIGATIAIFGIIDLLLLRSVPVRHPHELVHVTTAGERGSANSGSSNAPWFREVTSRTDLFSATMLMKHDMYKVGVRGAVEPVAGQAVSTNYYSVLGIPAALGRTFVAADQPDAGGSPVAVISHSFWQRRFGGDPTIIGAAITIDRRPFTIIGVAPPEFRGLFVGWTMEVTIPLALSEYADAGSWSTMPLIARLKPGVGPAHVGRQLDPLLKRFTATGVGERFRRRYLQQVVAESAAEGLSDLRAQFSRPLRLLMAAVALLLLIASVNLAGLLVARNAARQHELATRVALGAGRRRILQQLLTECALLAVCGAIPGLLLALYASNKLLAFLPAYFGPVSLAVVFDTRILAFTVAITAAATLLFGLIPAWQSGRQAVQPALRTSAPAAGMARLRLGRVLVGAQFALSLVLMAAAVLLVRTVLNLSRIDTGFDRAHALVVEVDPRGTEYDDGVRMRAFQAEMLAAFAGLPGVSHVSLATSSPFNGNINGRRLTVPGFEPRDPSDGIIQENLVGPGYFDVLRIPILQGRPLDARDSSGASPIVVVSEAFAQRYFGGAGAALGRRFTIGGGPSATTREIVGVARDVRYQSLRTESERMVYVPYVQTPADEPGPFEFLLRVEGDPLNWMNTARSLMQRLRPDAPIVSVRTLDAVIDDRVINERVLAVLGTFFALVALTLSAAGVYGLFAHLAARRAPEIGVRLTLGARPGQVLWMMLRETLTLAALGALVGLAVALSSLRVLEGLLFGLSPTDLTTLAGASLLLLLAALAAAYGPARRAAAVDPAIALRVQ
jgi:predicted permease